MMAAVAVVIVVMATMLLPHDNGWTQWIMDVALGIIIANQG